MCLLLVSQIMLDRYIAMLYLRYTALIAASLVGFFCMMDIIGSQGKMGDSANLIMLYVLFRACASLEIVLPLALIFGAIVTKIQLIRLNELTAAYSLGASRLRVLRVFVSISFAISLAYIAACSTDFAYFGDQADAIKEERFFASTTKDLFLKYDNRYIYISELSPIDNRARGIDIMEVENGEMSRYISAKNGFFEDNAWQLDDVTVTIKPSFAALGGDGLTKQRFDRLVALEGFRPDIMDTIFESKHTYSLIDAVRSWGLLDEQNMNTDRIRAVIYAAIVMPLFAPLFVVMIFVFVPISPRFFNVALFSSLAMLWTLVGWGSIVVLTELAKNGAIAPEAALLTPFALLFLIAGYLVRKIA
ncbi:hypothetical protein AGMMS50229_08650 [Campylobacterota bacterium]|nr:hypothetical protein AGMMS50229_08650 [Campylobacterota bacterium]